MILFEPYKAVRMMGIYCTKENAGSYLRMLNKDGLLPNSHKVKRVWQVDLEDIVRVKEKIHFENYKPKYR